MTNVRYPLRYLVNHSSDLTRFNMMYSMSKYMDLAGHSSYKTEEVEMVICVMVVNGEA